MKSADEKSKASPWQLNEEARRRQLREDGRRPLAVNLAAGLALSEFLATFDEDDRPSDSEALDVIRNRDQKG